MDHFFIFVFCLCHTVLSVSCSLVVTCWEMADLLAPLYVMFYYVYVTFPYGVLGQVWYLIYRFLIFAFSLTLIFNTGSNCFSKEVRTSVSKETYSNL